MKGQGNTMKMYRIYTEARDLSHTESIVSQISRNFTMIHAVGRYKSKQECTVIFELAIDGPDKFVRNLLRETATYIKEAHEQESVGILWPDNTFELA